MILRRLLITLGVVLIFAAALWVLDGLWQAQLVPPYEAIQ